jgi:Aspartyl protease
MFNVKWSALASLFILLPSAFAEAHCPGNVASVHVRHVRQYRNIVAVKVSINHSGPYSFLLDTGAQITSVDPALAGQLHLKPLHASDISGVTLRERVPVAQLDDLQVGDRSVPHSLVAIQFLGQLQAADPSIRGVLGGDFLRHFDVLIDHADGLLCLGSAGEMRSQIRGEQLAFAATQAEHGPAPTEPLILSVHLSGMVDRPFTLLLDSGANAPFLWKVEGAMSTRSVAMQRNISAPQGAGPAFAILPPQDLQIGKLLVHQISFATPAENSDASTRVDIDGLLPTAQFKSVYIDYQNRFVILQSW